MIWRVAMAAVALLFASGEAGAFCIENGIPARTAQASVVSARPAQPPRLWSTTAQSGKQECCNPRNLECNPDGGGDDGVVFFRARIEGAGTIPTPGATTLLPPAVCGVYIDERQRIVYAPARGYLRFEQNRSFNPQRRPNMVNAPFVARVLDAERKPITDLPCL